MKSYNHKKEFVTEIEKFKTDSKFDGTAKNPKWLGGMPEGNYELRTKEKLEKFFYDVRNS